jgi:carotenoid cleavage dioxygenase-like enzyme
MPIRFGNPFRIVDKDVRKGLEYKLSRKDASIIKKITGFYGLVGPDINKAEVSTLYDLFTGNGNIQGIFLKNGELTYVKHFIRTDKLVYEERFGKMPNNLLATVLLMILYKLKMFPNVLGLANTAIMNIDKKQYVLFEQDSPYLIDINFNNNNIETIKKNDINGIQHFSAHSKYNAVGGEIETIDYDAMTNIATYFKLRNDFSVISKRSIKTNYIPLIHDFAALDRYIIFCDSPMQFHMTKDMFLKMPVQFHKNKPTYLHIIDKTDLTTKTIKLDESFYIFHYADFKETSTSIEIYASIYEDIDYSEINIQGRYRKLIIDKETHKVSIEKNPELEKYSLEFPVQYGDLQILLRNHNNTFNGFVVCKGLYIVKDFYLDDDLCIAGEPKIIDIDKSAYLICFAYSSNDEGFLLLINLKDYHVIKLPLGDPINIGFHSILL